MANEKSKMKPIALLLTCIALTLSGCAASSKSPASYLGIDLKPAANAEPSKLQSLASRAKSGDKQAQLELGILFEAGRAGVEKDIEKAKSLYAKAAKDTAVKQTSFIPNGNAVQAVQVSTGKVNKGLDEAKRRLNWYEPPEGSLDAFVKLALSYYDNKSGQVVFRPDTKLFNAFDTVNPFEFLEYCKNQSEGSQAAIAALCDLNPDGLKFYAEIDIFYEACAPARVRWSSGDLGNTWNCFLDRSIVVDSSILDFTSARTAWRTWAYASTIKKCEHRSEGGCPSPDDVGKWFVGTPTFPLPNKPLSMFSAVVQDSFNYAKWRGPRQRIQHWPKPPDDRNNYSDHWIGSYCLDRISRYRPKPMLSRGERILCNTYNDYYLRRI